MIHFFVWIRSHKFASDDRSVAKREAREYPHRNPMRIEENLDSGSLGWKTEGVAAASARGLSPDVYGVHIVAVVGGGCPRVLLQEHRHRPALVRSLVVDGVEEQIETERGRVVGGRNTVVWPPREGDRLVAPLLARMIRSAGRLQPEPSGGSCRTLSVSLASPSSRSRSSRAFEGEARTRPKNFPSPSSRPTRCRSIGARVPARCWVPSPSGGRTRRGGSSRTLAATRFSHSDAVACGAPGKVTVVSRVGGKNLPLKKVNIQKWCPFEKNLRGQ